MDLLLPSSLSPRLYAPTPTAAGLAGRLSACGRSVKGCGQVRGGGGTRAGRRQALEDAHSDTTRRFGGLTNFRSALRPVNGLIEMS